MAAKNEFDIVKHLNPQLQLNEPIRKLEINKNEIYTKYSLRKLSGRKYPVKVNFNLSVIRQKGESQNGDEKKTKHAKFSEKQTFLTH